MTILKLLANNGFISYNKEVARQIGVHEAIVLGELCSVANLFSYQEFYFSQEKMSYDTGLSEKQVRNALKTLEGYGFFRITKKGNPCKNWYFLEENVIENFFKESDENGGTSSAEMAEQDRQNLPNKIGKNGGTSSAEMAELLSKKNTGSKNANNNTNINSPGEPPEGETKDRPWEKPKPKKADSFPQEYYDQIYQAYLENYRKLYPDKGDPDIMYGYLNKSIKNALKTYGFEKVLEAVKISVTHQFLLDNGYPLSFIFGSKELPMLINRTFSTQQKSGYTGKPYYKNFDKAALGDRDFFAGTEYEEGTW